MTRLLTVPERHPGWTVAAIGIIFMLAYGTSLILLPKPDGRIVIGDALHHYVQLRSVVFDHDLHFRNDYVRLYGLAGNEPGTEWVYESTATGHVRNLMPVGPGLVWAPVFLLVSAGVWVAGLFGGGYPLDGYGRLFQAAAGFSGIAAATAGSWFAYRAAAALFGARTAVWATLTVWLSSSTIYYSVISPTYSHAASMLAVSAFWFAWITTLEAQTPARYATIGLLAGVAALMRWQDAVLLLIPAAEAAWHHREAPATATIARLVACGAGAVAGFLPQMAVWMVLYGTPLAMPQGSGFMKWGDPAIVSVLFSSNHGLVTWTPVAGIALLGLVPLARRAALVGLAAVLFFGFSWYVNAAVADWWGGEAFGSRRFISCFPIFVLGMAALLERLGGSLRGRAVIAMALTLHTALLLVQYQAYMHGLRGVVRYPHDFESLWIDRFRVPFDLLAWWIGR